MKQLKAIVKRNIEHAQTRQNEVSPSDISGFRYWEGYINALESIVHVLPEQDEEYER
jgi:hypothetical protein